MTSLRIGALGLCLLACGTLLDLDKDASDRSSSGSSDEDAAVGDDDDGSSSSSGTGSSSGRSSSSGSSSGTSSGSASGGASSSGGGPPLWADVQLSLSQLRQQGPLTSAQSQGQCTDHYFFWKETDGTLHSWFADDGTVIDYAFNAPSRSFFRASDAYVAVDTQPRSNKIDVYRTTAANQKVTQLDTPESWVATHDGVLLVQTVSATSARIAKWTEAQGTTPLTTSDLTTQQSASAYGNGQLLLPGGVVQPYPLYLIDAANGSVDSVNFGGALVYRAGVPSPRGLFVSYARQEAPTRFVGTETIKTRSPTRLRSSRRILPIRRPYASTSSSPTPPSVAVARCSMVGSTASGRTTSTRGPSRRCNSRSTRRPSHRTFSA